MSEWSRQSRPRASSRRTRRTCTALDGLSFAVGAGHRVRAARPERRRQVDRGQDPHHADRARTPGAATVAGHRRDSPQPDGVRRTIGVVAQGSGVDIQATGRENLRLQGQIYGMRGRALEQRARSCSSASGWPTPPTGSRAATRAACSAAWTSRWRWSTTPRCCSSTSRRPASIPRSAPTCGRRSPRWRPSGARPCCSPRTTSRRPTSWPARVAIVDRGKVVAEGTPEELKRELRGDAIHVELEAESNGAVGRALGELAGVRDVAVDGRALRARADDGGRAVPAVLQALEAHGVDGRRRSAWPARRSTTSISGTPAARSTRPRPSRRR